MEIDASGRMIEASSSPQMQMPYLLGDLGQYLIEPLPQDNQVTWETTGTCGITEGSSGRPFGPGMMPRPRFGPRFQEEPKPARQAAEKSVYTRGAAVGDIVTIQKRYELKADATATSQGLNLSGDATITFDTKDGLPRAVEFKGSYTVSSVNKTLRVPLTVSYKLIEGADRDKVLNPPPPPKVDPKAPAVNPNPPMAMEAKPLTEAELNKVLEDIKGANRGPRRLAMHQLSRAKPTEARRAEVAKALEQLLAAETTDVFNRKGLIDALGTWGTKDTVTVLIPLVADANIIVRHGAIDALAKLKDERAAEPLAKRLPEFIDRTKASQALQALGSKAEKAVHPYLKNDDVNLKLAVCQLLQTIGTKESKTALEEASKDANVLVAALAKQALQAAVARP
jgi:hypothetical protein